MGGRLTLSHIARALTTPKLAQPTMLKYLLIALSLTAVLADLEDLDANLPMELIDGQTSSFLDEIGNDMDVKVEDVAQAENNMNDMDVEVEDVAGGVTCKDVCYKDKCYATLTNGLRRLPSGTPWNRIKSSYKGGCCFLGRGKCDRCCITKNRRPRLHGQES